MRNGASFDAHNLIIIQSPAQEWEKKYQLKAFRYIKSNKKFSAASINLSQSQERERTWKKTS